MIKELNEYIDEFLLKYPREKYRIKKLSEKYKMSDFILVENKLKNYFENNEKSSDNIIGLIYQPRIHYFRLDISKTESRLTREYMEFLHNLLKNNKIKDKVFYITAYHYLSLGKSYGYKLTASPKAAFPISFTNELYPRTKERIKTWNDDRIYVFSEFVTYFIEEDAKYFNNFYKYFSRHHHATKNFSLIDYIIDQKVSINSDNFPDIAELFIDNFVFNSKAIFITRMVSIYTGKTELNNIKSKLISLDEQKL